MISAELIRRYPFFAGLDLEQINKLAKLGTEEIVEEGHYFFHEDNDLDKFFVNLEGAVGIVYEVPERDVEHKVADQFARKLKTKDICTIKSLVFSTSICYRPFFDIYSIKSTTLQELPHSLSYQAITLANFLSTT